jgi:hypothetical protein
MSVFTTVNGKRLKVGKLLIRRRFTGVNLLGMECQILIGRVAAKSLEPKLKERERAEESALNR